MKGKTRWLLGPLVILALLLCAVPAYASVPTIPHPFYGTITIGGSDAPVGTVVTAEVGGVECGSITTTVEGQYGGSGAFDEKLLVSGEIETGATISFYADGNEADQTYAFEAGGDPTELNLTVAPPPDTTPPTVSITALTPDPTDDTTPDKDTIISGNTFTTVNNGVLIGASSGGGLVSDTAPGKLEVSSNTFSGCKFGIDLTNAADTAHVHDVRITRNTFTNNTEGLAINHGDYPNASDKWQPEDFTVQYNDFSGNTHGIYNDADASAALPAPYNWWDDVTGPGDAIGTGDTGTVSSTPWLAKSQSECVIASYPALSTALSVGWNTLSTPAKLISTADAIDELVPTGVSIAYYYDNGWVLVTTGYVLNPCNAIYIKMDSAQSVLFQVDGAAFHVPTKDLVAGWNLASCGSMTDKNAEDAVASISGSLGQVVSPSPNASEWVYITSTTTDEMVVGEGYWIFMASAATLGGFTLCPIAPQY